MNEKLSILLPPPYALIDDKSRVFRSGVIYYLYKMAPVRLTVWKRDDTTL